MGTPPKTGGYEKSNGFIALTDVDLNPESSVYWMFGLAQLI